jgi:hypothetical protein
MTIEEEIEHLGEMRHVGMALLQFSRSLFKGEFKKKSEAWIYSPNFVSFEIRFKRVQKLNVLVRPTKVPQEVSKVLPLYGGRLIYGRAEVRSPRQLGAACAYIEASWRDWYRETFRKDPDS